MKIGIKGTIIPSDEAWIYDWFGIENTSPKRVNDALLEANGEDVDVDINSGGGDVFSGSEIYTALSQYEGNVNIHVVGLAASAASVIAMAGHSDMSPTAQMMIHNVSMNASGDYREHDHASDILQTANKSIAAAYVAKTGMAEKDILKMMDKETWFTAKEAVELGLIDEVMESKQNPSAQLVASFVGSVLPKKLIDEYQSKKHSLQADIDRLKNMEV